MVSACLLYNKLLKHNNQDKGKTMIMKNTLATLVVILSTHMSFQANAGDKAWYFITALCANCNSDGSDNNFNDGANSRFFVSNVIYAGKYAHACKEGAFYNKTGLVGTESFGFSSESKAYMARDKKISDLRRDDYIIHNIALQKYPDCN